MSFVQRQLIKYLETEVYHSLGSYRVALHGLEELAKNARDATAADVLAFDQVVPPDVVETNREYNHQLIESLHTTGVARRHPRPARQKQFPPFPVDAHKHAWVLHFYHLAIKALEEDTDGSLLANALLFVEGVPHGRQFTADNSRRTMRLARYRARLSKAKEIIPSRGSTPPVESLLSDCLSSEPTGPHAFVITALADAHFRLHEVEHRHSGALRAYLTVDHEDCNRDLQLSICLNTFVFAISRSAPWIFAADHREREQISATCYSEARQVLSPPHCMWAAQLISILSLMRRAYARMLLEEKAAAFNDYLKAQRLIRFSSRTLNQAATRLQTSVELLACLDALAEQHVGELYRSDHAHGRAFEHFCNAYERLEHVRRTSGAKRIAWLDISLDHMLEHSRWPIELMLSKGKTFYELGQMKRALKWYVSAWRAVLRCSAYDDSLETNTASLDSLEEWLTRTQTEPDLGKVELSQYFHAVCLELGSLRVSKRLESLAADILGRIGHLLFVLKLGTASVAPAGHGLHELSHVVLATAAKLDPHNTLVRSNLRMIALRNPSIAPQVELPALDSTQQWPGGGGDFEQFARAYEHELLMRLDTVRDERSADGMAVSLLLDFLTHTDNINLKMAQVYRFLMGQDLQGSTKGFAGPAIEFTCLRRYSSFFPFLPRPHSSRALGGGYLVRIVSAGRQDRAFGIAVDPGANFVENLYRCGFSLADIDMIIASHDHVDHIASLDPLLTLLGYRRLLGDQKFTYEDSLPIIGNRSVLQRYEFFNRPDPFGKENERPAPVRVFHLDEWEQCKGQCRKIPSDLQLNVAKALHPDAGRDHSYGLQIRVGHRGPSIAFTGDTGRYEIRDRQIQFREWYDVTSEAQEKYRDRMLQSDVVVEHISSVPLTQLRQLARIADEPDALLELYKEIGGRPVPQSQKLCNEIKFAFWLPKKKKEEIDSELEKLCDAPRSYMPPANHNYLAGILWAAERYKSVREGKGGLMIIGELREELGSFRTKIARGLNESVFPKDGTFRAITADVGLSVRLTKDDVRVRCSSCSMDNDYALEECYHRPAEIREVCVKGENEGIFYNCPAHDPGAQLDDPVFLERLERYDILS